MHTKKNGLYDFLNIRILKSIIGLTGGEKPR